MRLARYWSSPPLIRGLARAQDERRAASIARGSRRTRARKRSGCITRQCWSSRLPRPSVKGPGKLVSWLVSFRKKYKFRKKNPANLVAGFALLLHRWRRRRAAAAAGRCQCQLISQKPASADSPRLRSAWRSSRRSCLVGRPARRARLQTSWERVRWPRQLRHRGQSAAGPRSPSLLHRAPTLWSPVRCQWEQHLRQLS